MITQRDGIHFDLDSRTYVADSKSSAGDLTIVSHAHFDHIHTSDSDLICSEVTARLSETRTGESFSRRREHPVKLIPSGHIIGSRAALFGDQKKILYTGDVSTRDRLYLDGFEPLSADVLVIESTYGIPAYRFPDHREVEKRFSDWVKGNSGENLYLFGYSLGKAQKIQKMVEKHTDRRILLHGAVEKTNAAVEEATELEFSGLSYTDNNEMLEEGNAVVVAPSRLSNSDWADSLKDNYSGISAGFSGWAVSDSFQHRGNYDETFVLSDHCGFSELLELVEEVEPEKVYTHHGFAEAFARHLSSELGYTASALKKNQRSLDSFS